MNIPDIRSEPDLEGKRVLLRSSLNVPLYKGVVRNDFRLSRAVPTIKLLQKQGARTIVIGHIGRGSDNSLEPVFRYLREQVGLSFESDITNLSASQRIRSMRGGDVVLLENVRRRKEEQQNGDRFSRELASLGDMYVNDAFAASHRPHASVVGIPVHIPGYAGPSLLEEIKRLGAALTPPESSLCILGGAKFETKEPLIRKFLNTYGYVFVGGALANDLFKTQGLEVGRSLISRVEGLEDILRHPRLVLPSDVTVEREGAVTIKRLSEIEKEDAILDVGPETVARLRMLVRQSAFVLWNGPLGNYERGFRGPTEELAQALAESRASSIVGGGDTVAAISSLRLLDSFGFVSTGGGAMLEFLLKGTLPGVEALRRN